MVITMELTNYAKMVELELTSSSLKQTIKYALENKIRVCDLLGDDGCKSLWKSIDIFFENNPACIFDVEDSQVWKRFLNARYIEG